MIINNERGSLTIDFLFATVLVMGVSGLLFALCFTLTVVEISQYIAFASSRNYYGSNFNEQVQISQAEEKFNQLVYDSPWKVLFKKDGWFALKYINTGDFRSEYPNDIDEDNAKFWGTILEIQSKVLDFKIPFYGSTNPEDNMFKAKITSFLGREPSAEECVNFHNERFDKIKRLNSKFQGNVPNTNVKSFYDNGC
ncbi:MAG: hypothetical protein KDD37_05245 [Bdellovibrionales bacterium]|nr:hypothetical protein [Bdellovibrionales bacterium]